MSEEKSVFDLEWAQQISDSIEDSSDLGSLKTKLTSYLNTFKTWINNDKYRIFVTKTLSQQSNELILYFAELQLTLPFRMFQAEYEKTSTITLGDKLSAALHDQKLLFTNDQPHILETIRQHISLRYSETGKSIDFLVYPGINGPIYTIIDPLDDPDGISMVITDKQLVDKLKEFVTTSMK